MILNLPPTKAFHLDTLSSLNFANRTKKIEVREIENEFIFKGPARLPTAGSGWGRDRHRHSQRFHASQNRSHDRPRPQSHPNHTGDDTVREGIRTSEEERLVARRPTVSTSHAQREISILVV